MSHNKQQRRINGDHQMADGYEDHEEDTHHIHEGLTNHPIRNKNTKNNNVRGSHSEKPNKRLTNGMMNNQPLYSITKPQNYLEEVAKEEPFESDHDDRKNKFKDENSHNRQGVLGIDQSPSKSKTIKTMSLGRELRKKQFKDFPKPLSAEDTMNLIVESFLEGDEGYCLDPDHVILPNFEEARHSSKPNGLIQAYAANTNQGVFRNYNEDRVSIILNITKPSFKQIENWPTCSFFAVYDGHGGASCADFLRDNLHQFIVKQTSFPSDPVTAIRDGFAEAESFFLEIVENAADEAMKEAGETNFEGFVDNSGSCAVVILIIDRTVYMANVGDSRTIMSANGGRNAYSLSKDHKPNEEGEAFRILNNGGKIYQTQTMVPKLDGSGNECILGPHRVFPGRLSVSRSFGDIEAKLPKYGGNMKVIVADPEIRVFEITDNLDFIILACDGIYDKLSNKEIQQIVWEGVIDSKSKDPHQQCGIAVDRILKTSVAKKTMDNITVVFIAFSNFEDCQKTLNPYYIDEEHIEEEQFPEKCVSDFEYIQGRCETPHYLKPKPKGSRIKYEPPTIITSNPEELAMLPPQVPQNFNMQSSESEPSHNELNEENFHENMIAEQPYMQTNLKVQNQNEIQKQMIDISQPVKVHKYDSENSHLENKDSINDSNQYQLKTNIFSSFEQEKVHQMSSQNEDNSLIEYSENSKEHSFHPPQYMNKPESINNGK